MTEPSSRDKPVRALERDKICSKCRVMKPISAFNKRKDSCDGLTFQCRQCYSDYSKKYYQNHKMSKKQYYKMNKVLKSIISATPADEFTSC